MSLQQIINKINEKHNNRLYASTTVTVARILECAADIAETAAVLTEFGTDLATLRVRLAQRLAGDNLPVQQNNNPRTRIGTAMEVQAGASAQPYIQKVMEIFQRDAQAQQGQPQAQMPEGPSFKQFLQAIHQVESVQQTQPFMHELKEARFDWDKFLAVENEKNSEKNIVAELCINLNEEAKAGRIDPVIHRDAEVEKVIEALNKRRSNNCILLGPAGVGKTAIAEGLACKIVDGQVPPVLAETIIYSLNIADLMAGTSFRGQLEEKIKKLVDYFKKQKDEGKSVILFIDEIHTVMGQGANGADINNMIKPALSRGDLRCIGATTTSEWNAFVRQDKAFARRFEQVDINEFSIPKTIEVLNIAKAKYEAFHGVKYDDAAVESAVRLAVEYINKSALPDKAFQIFDLAGAASKVKVKDTVTVADIEEVLAKHRGINLEIITKDKEKKKRKIRLAPEIKKSVFHQDQAVDAMVKPVERHQAGMASSNKPIASLLFVGPTGVGKTEAAKALSKSLNCPLIRFDMSEYQDSFAVTKLIGSPPGYVGSEQNGALSDAIEKNPYCVLLLDEIEKADPKITEIFLQIMDNAKFKNNKSEEIDCKNVVIIYTSNAGATERQKTSISLESDKTVQESKANAKVNAFFSPEFRNRLNGVVQFNALQKEHMLPIVTKFVEILNQKEGIASRNLKVTLDEEAQNWIVNKDFNPNFGARPIERKIASYIEDVVVEAILDEKVSSDTEVKVSVKDGNLSFDYSKTEASPSA